jgi:hypothetical protein
MGCCLDDSLQGRDARGLRERTMYSTRVAPARTWRATKGSGPARSLADRDAIKTCKFGAYQGDGM